MNKNISFPVNMDVYSIYDFNDYKAYFNAWVENQPKAGHGEYRRLAISLNVSTTMISQVFKGDKHLSLELASEICDYLRFNDEEADYFLLLVEYQRAGSQKLHKRLKRQVLLRQEKARKLENRVKAAKEMSDEVKNIFYSSWMYSGVRLLTGLEEMNNAAIIAERLSLPRNQVQKILDFLITNHLVLAEKTQLKMGPARTHIGSSSLLVNKHHQNWRLQGFSKMISPDEKNFFYTGPMSLSEEVAGKIRQELPSFIEKINAQIIPSPSEVVRCLNIDWFEY